MSKGELHDYMEAALMNAGHHLSVWRNTQDGAALQSVREQAEWVVDACRALESRTSGN